MDWIQKESLKQIRQKPRKTKELQDSLNIAHRTLYPRLKELEGRGLIEMSIEKNKAIWRQV